MKQSSNAKIASTPRKRGGGNRVQHPRYCQADRCFLSTLFLGAFWQQVFQSVCRHRYDLYVPHILVICGASTTGFRFQTTCSSVGHLQPASVPPHPTLLRVGGGGWGCECYYTLWCRVHLELHCRCCRGLRGYYDISAI